MVSEKHDDSALTGECAIRLLKAVSETDCGLDNLIAIGREMLGNPIAVTDKSRKAIAMTTDIGIPDDLHWNELLTNGCLSAQSVTMAIRDNLTDRLELSDDPFVWQGRDMKYPRMMCKVAVNRKLTATVSVIGYFKVF